MSVLCQLALLNANENKCSLFRSYEIICKASHQNVCLASLPELEFSQSVFCAFLAFIWWRWEEIDWSYYDRTSLSLLFTVSCDVSCVMYHVMIIMTNAIAFQVGPFYQYNSCKHFFHNCLFSSVLIDNLGEVSFILCIHHLKYKYDLFAK